VAIFRSHRLEIKRGRDFIRGAQTRVVLVRRGL
jgi:hypothetical protein